MSLAINLAPSVNEIEIHSIFYLYDKLFLSELRNQITENISFFF
jgi:hypothetical protein